MSPQKGDLNMLQEKDKNYVAYLRGWALGKSEVAITAKDFYIPFTDTRIEPFDEPEQYAAFALGLYEGRVTTGEPSGRKEIDERIQHLVTI